MSGEVDGMALTSGMLIFMSLFYLIPLWLAFISLTVKDSCNRWTNFILGIVFTLLNLYHFIEHLTSPVQILIIGSAVAVTALIAWYAWRWPKQ